MKKTILMVIIMLLVSQIAFSSTTVQTINYEPYQRNEFPEWSYKLRRGETLLFGSLPITLSMTGITYSVVLGLGAQKISANPFKESLAILGIAATLSLIIAITDYIIGEVSE
jgi:hypothetical protein